ncbi:hypothetical protein LTR66_008062 [Elasticomyces elasticus]|nr:hypothetical protein LTR66_008062 [Elasticomyces elasticus]
MLANFQARYARVETALNTLVDSIASYNPSVAAADELVAADDEVSESLHQLATHQANYARIVALRQTAESLDEKIKSTIRLLADTRKELLATPATTFPPATREIDVDELLSYARFISKTTVPPTFRKPIPQEVIPGKPSVEGMVIPETQITNGIATPPPGAGEDTQTRSLSTQQRTSKGVAELPQDTKDWLDPLSKLPFVPWPAEELLRSGALAEIQMMVEEGKDPTTVLGPEEFAEAEQRRAEEEALKERESAEKNEAMSFAARRRANVASAAARTEDVFDPDDV